MKPQSDVQYVVDPKSGCWVWQRSVGSHGYGQMSSETSRVDLAHRVFYERVNGPIPEGLELDHLCCNKRCVNPAHLEPVRHGTNTRRAIAKLTVEAAADIRRRSAHGERVAVMAEEYGVAQRTVRAVLYGETWVAA